MIRQLFDDPALCARLGAQAAEAALQFTWERNARDLTALFQKILQQKESPTPPR